MPALSRASGGAMMGTMRRAVLGMLAVAGAVAGAAWAAESGETARAYQRMCAQCHGVDGDGLFYENIVPLAGIQRRYPAETVGRLSGAFSGRTLRGAELERMVAYMGTLRGEKGFAEPGWIASPYFVEKKAPRVGEVRILDARTAAAFDAVHVPNARRVEAGACIEAPERTREWMRAEGVGEGMLVIAVDERGGPEAACVWWRLRRAGHKWIAVMDGGMRRYRAERLPVEGTGAAVEAAHEAAGWWRETLDERGFLPQEALARVADGGGFPVGAHREWQGTEAELAHLILTLGLLGREARYDEASRRVLVDAPVR